MILALMAYSIAAGAALMGVGALVERLAAGRRRPRRFAWMVTLGALLTLTTLAPWRAGVDTAAAGALARFATLGAVPGRTAVTIGETVARLRASAGAAGDALGRFDDLILWLWTLASVGIVIGHVAGRRVLAHRRQLWQRTVVDGEPVWLSATDGPALVGVWSPAVVLPAWMLDLSPEARRLTLLHEREHERAHDPLLLQLASLGPLLMPWNPAAWWMVSRVKLAVEMDCDARVLGHASGDAPRGDVDAYGELLLAVASKRSMNAGWLAPAMLERSSHLRRRLSAMYVDRIDRSSVGSAAFGAAAALFAVLIVALPGPVVHAGATQSAERSQGFGKGAYRSGERDVTFPVAIRQVNPQYTREAMQAKITGMVEFEFVVNADGTVGQTRIVKSLDKKYGLDDAARKALQNWRFKPATLHGKPVPVICDAELEFRLR